MLIYYTAIMDDKYRNQTYYCPVGTLQKRFGAYLTGAGHERTLPGEAYPHSYHSSDYYFTWAKGRKLADWEYQLLYIRSGRGVIEFKRGRPIPIGAGTLIVIHPGEWHRYRPDSDAGWEETYIGIGGALIERLVAPPFFAMSPTIVTMPVDSWFDREFLELEREIQSASAERPYTLALKVLAMIAAVVERAKTFSAANANNISIRRATLHIGHHLHEVIDFAAMATTFGMSYSLFRKRFRDYTGLAPLEYQNALRIRRAINLLGSSSIPIARIAGELGFRSPAYFARFFRKSTGQPPTFFRQKSESLP